MLLPAAASSQLLPYANKGWDLYSIDILLKCGFLEDI